jgi:hypothetical protein
MNPTDFTPPKDEAGPETTTVTIDASNIQSLGFRLHDRFSINEKFRWAKEQEWLQSLRQYNKIYDPEIEAKMDKNRSKAYPGVTRSKVVSVESRLHEICFPDVGKNWSIDPSPYSTISNQGMQIVMQTLMAKAQEKAIQEAQAQIGQGNILSTEGLQIEQPSEEAVQLEIQRYARAQCAKMEVEMDDQLTETKYDDKTKKALHSGILLGTGVMKGPLAQQQQSKRWKINPESGTYELETKDVPRPYFEFTRIWDWYPDMTVTEWEDAEGGFERHVMTKHAVRKLSKRSDFNADKINTYLTANPGGDCTFKTWEIELQTIASEYGEMRRGRQYEVLEFWGYIDGRDLAECGVTIDEARQDIEFEANVWILGTEVIKAVLNPTATGTRPWHVFYFEKDETSIFGRGLPKIMRDTALTIAAAARMMLDNGAVSWGPQVEVNIDLLDRAQDIESFHGNKIWVREGTGQEANYPAVRMYHVESHIEEYLKVIEQWMNFCDLETAFPTYMLIEPQSVGNETAQGASLRSGTINVTVKDVARNFDGFNSDIIDDTYAWNMAFSDREDIKGDYKVKSKGYSSLVAKEVRAMQLQQTNQSLTDSQRVWVKDKEYLTEMWKAQDLPPDVLRTEEEHRQYISDTTDPRVMELQIEKLAAEVEKLRATALSQIARAKKSNVDATDTAYNIGKDTKKA